MQHIYFERVEQTHCPTQCENLDVHHLSNSPKFKAIGLLECYTVLVASWFMVLWDSLLVQSSMICLTSEDGTLQQKHCIAVFFL
jgi:hypothetical protein